jgi:hypothetical protein
MSRPNMPRPDTSWGTNVDESRSLDGSAMGHFYRHLVFGDNGKLANTLTYMCLPYGHWRNEKLWMESM